MDLTIIFPILLFLKSIHIMKLSYDMNNKYLWKLLFIRDNRMRKIIKSYQYSYITHNNPIINIQRKNVVYFY